MAMTEARILTICWDSRTGMFDDSPLRGYLADREILRAVPEFFTYREQPCWSVYLETRPLVGAETRKYQPGVEADILSSDRTTTPMIAEFDEIQQVRYDRILQWRRDAARREGLPHYVLCTNKQAEELARIAPNTLSALSTIHGFGGKRLKKYGREILEALHGQIGDYQEGTGNAGDIRKMDAGDGGLLSDVGGLSEKAQTVVDGQDGKPVFADTGTADQRGVHEEQDTDTGQR